MTDKLLDKTSARRIIDFNAEPEGIVGYFDTELLARHGLLVELDGEPGPGKVFLNGVKTPEDLQDAIEFAQFLTAQSAEAAGRTRRRQRLH